jgi:hypothetical protein
MKTITFKQVALAGALFLSTSVSFGQHQFGSLSEQFTLQEEKGTTNLKVVTVGNKLWGWQGLNNDLEFNYVGFESMVELYGAPIGGSAQEIWLPRQNVGGYYTEAWGSSDTHNGGWGSTTPLDLSKTVYVGAFAATEGRWVHSLERYAYNPAANNSAVAGDVTVPEIFAALSSVRGGMEKNYKMTDENNSSTIVPEYSAIFDLLASDDSNNYFYFIEDAANGVFEVSFVDEHYVVFGIDKTKTYNFTVTPVDFSGNEGTPIVLVLAPATGIDKVNAESVAVAASNGELTVSGTAVQNIAIYSVAGQLVSTANNTNTVNVASLAKGVYLVKINGNITKKVII